MNQNFAIPKNRYIFRIARPQIHISTNQRESFVNHDIKTRVNRKRSGTLDAHLRMCYNETENQLKLESINFVHSQMLWS